MHWRPKAKNTIGRGDKDQHRNARGTKKDVLKIILEHGDIMVMHGSQIQEFYEVSELSKENEGLIQADQP
jgi:alkylated DNA repair dioxygenase AlkB